MGFWTAVIIIVAIGAFSSTVTAIVNAIRPKIKRKDMDELKSEILQDLTGGGGTAALPDYRNVQKRIDLLEEQVETQQSEIQHLSEENTFLKRLIEK